LIAAQADLSRKAGMWFIDAFFARIRKIATLNGPSSSKIREVLCGNEKVLKMMWMMMTKVETTADEAVVWSARMPDPNFGR
jgi:hypothetical protein